MLNIIQSSKKDCADIVDEQLKTLFYNNIHFGISAQVLVALLSFLGLSTSGFSTPLSIWFGLLMTLSLGIIFLKFLRQHITDNKISTMIHIAVLTMIFFGSTLWGMMPFIPLHPTTHIDIYYYAIFLIALSAGGLFFLTPCFKTYICYLLIILLPYTIALWRSPDIYLFWDATLVVFLVTMAICGFLFNHHLRSLFNLQCQNVDLNVVNEQLEKAIKGSTQKIEESNNFLKSVVSATSNGIVVTNLQFQIQFFNQRFIDIWQLQNLNLNQIKKNIITEEYLKKKIINYESFLEEVTQLRAHPNHTYSGELESSDRRHITWNSTPLKQNEDIVGHVWDFQDISNYKELEKKLAFQANHDLLTGIPNRRFLMDKLPKEISLADRFDSYLVVVFLDIDNFKLINDGFGHTIGDEVLKTYASRFHANIRKTDLVARYGGDEFVFLFHVKKLSHLDVLAEQLLKAVNEPVRIKDEEIVMTATLGGSIYPRDGKTKQELMKHANIAVHFGKKYNQNSFKLYENHLDVEPKEIINIHRDLSRAVKHDELFLHFQPVVDLCSGNIVSVEALVRWQHPRRGMVMPNEFIKVSETSGLIVEIGKLVFDKACAQLAKWQHLTSQKLKIAINLSIKQIKNDHFIDDFLRVISQYDIQCHQVDLEFTETLLMENRFETHEILRTLKQKGFCIVIDDFGKGYSSLSYLENFPFDQIKIDKSFVENIHVNESSAKLLKTILSMGKALDVKILAEGVETLEQLQFIRDNGCDLAQGYYFTKPLDPELVEELIIQNPFTKLFD